MAQVPPSSVSAGLCHPVWVVNGPGGKGSHPGLPRAPARPRPGPTQAPLAPVQPTAGAPLKGHVFLPFTSGWRGGHGAF